ncbi:MAG: hypothetical protein AB8G15_18365 [Saprospiraceae bacterium]
MKFTTHLLQASLFLFLFCHCSNTKKMSYTYTDGNNNSYRIHSQQLRYSPMTKALSSSGDYSGGTPQTIDLTKEQVQEIESLITAAFDKKSIHIRQRNMGSASISRFVDKNAERVMIRAFCAEQRAIDSYLKKLLK